MKTAVFGRQVRHVAMALLLVGCGPGGLPNEAMDAQMTGCTKDTDCKDDRVCNAGVCTAPMASDMADAAADAAVPDGSGDMAVADGSLTPSDAAVALDLSVPPDLAPSPDLHSLKTLSFAAPKLMAAGGGAQVIALGDLHGNGKLDVVTASSASPGYVFVLVNTGGGTFAYPVKYTGEARPAAIALGDLNSDGKVDVVATNVDPNTGADDTISVFLGHGDGTLAPPLNSAAGILIQNSAVALGDFNEDHKLDVVTSGQHGEGLLLGNGDGTLAAPANNYIESGAPILVADYDGDHHLDLAGTFSNVLRLDYGTGTGAFDPTNGGHAYATPWMMVNAMVAADFNHDGHVDIAGLAGASSMSCVLGPNFAKTMPTMSSLPAAASGLAIADFNLDGAMDIASVSGTASTGTVGILLGNGDGTFAPYVSIDVDASAVAIAAGDVDRDGKPDILTVSGALSELAVLLNTSQ